MTIVFLVEAIVVVVSSAILWWALH